MNVIIQEAMSPKSLLEYHIFTGKLQEVAIRSPPAPRQAVFIPMVPRDGETTYFSPIPLVAYACWGGIINYSNVQVSAEFRVNDSIQTLTVDPFSFSAIVFLLSSSPITSPFTVTSRILNGPFAAGPTSSIGYVANPPLGSVWPNAPPLTGDRVCAYNSVHVDNPDEPNPVWVLGAVASSTVGTSRIMPLPGEVVCNVWNVLNQSRGDFFMDSTILPCAVVPGIYTYTLKGVDPAPMLYGSVGRVVNGIFLDVEKNYRVSVSPQLL